MAASAPLISGLFSFVENLIKIHRLNEWTKVIVGFVFSYATTFSFVCAPHSPQASPGALPSAQE
jgi:hypothetical protein